MHRRDDLLDQLSTAVVHLDERLTILDLNQAAEALFEASRQRSIGASIGRLFCDPSTPTSALLDALAQGHAFTKRGATLRTPTGAALAADYAVSVIIDRSPPELLIEVQPLDRMLRINRDDHHASVQDTTRKLVRSLAHEIKNPLGGIRGAAQLLERELTTDRERDYTRVIIAEADRLRNLVDRMLGPSQLPKIAPVNLHQVLERVVQLIDAEANGRIRMVRDYDPSLPDLDADLEQLIQAMLNIVRNAAQALEQTPEPEIVLRTRIIRQFTIGSVRHRLVARIDVKDNGPGVPPDIFDRMYYPMISGRVGGSGLGLSIAQRILDQHHGLIECESRRGETTFTVYLPLEQPHGSK
jgi:two-component system, NtrC family, nitrogen regulation sensor histidine kinase GlnL